MHSNSLASKTKTGQELDPNWHNLYAFLNRCVPHIVYRMRVSSWYGQEKDVIEDIVQETMRRVIERIQKADRGDAEPIHSLTYMARAIALNYCRDLVRLESRFIHGEEALAYGYGVNEDTVNCLDIAVDMAYRKTLFILLARSVVRFPPKQRRALFIDLASHMAFEKELTSLQEAFLSVGVNLQEYRHLLPNEPEEQYRHRSLLSHVYKRIAHLTDIYTYTGDTLTRPPC